MVFIRSSFRSVAPGYPRKKVLIYFRTSISHSRTSTKNGTPENSDRDELWPGRLPKHAPDPQKGLGLFFVFF